MKKFLFSALGAGLLLTSCQSDEPLAPGNGLEQQVAFTVSLPDAVSTRAGGTNSAAGGVSNNMNADVTFNVALYLDGRLVFADNKTVQSAGNGTSATFKPTLVIGENYQLVAFAEFDNDASASGQGLNPATNMGLIKMESGINNEKNDEYFVSTTLTAAPELSATLKRPYGKLRLVAEDLHEAERQFGAKVESVEVTYKYTRPTNFNVIAGTFDPAYTEAAQTFTAAYGKYTNETDAARTIFVDYIPGKFDGSESMMPFTVTVKFVGGKTYTRDFRQDIPVKRNHLTTLKGRLFTIDSDLKLTIEEGFDGETLLDYVTTAKELQQTIDAAGAGTTTIYLGANITDDVTILQKKDVNIVIDGLGSKWDGTIKIHNGSNYNNGSITIKNVNFETSDDKRNFIEALENGGERYSNNIKVEGCTFTSPATRSNYNDGVVGVQVKATRGVTVEDCIASNIHSLIQAQSCDTGDVKVLNCKINGCKNGVAFKQVKSATVEGCEINVAAYGIRFDGNIDNYGITVKNNKVTADQPLIVRKMTGKNNTITLEGYNELTPKTTGDYQIVITNGSDDEDYVMPTGTFTLVGADDFKVYPAMPVAKIGNTEYTSIDEAIANWTNGTTLTLVKNVTLNDVVTLKSTEYRVLDLGIYTMTAAKGKDAISITAEGRSSASYALDIKADATNPGGITATSKAVVKTTGKSGVKDRPIIRFYNGVFNASNIISHSGSSGTNSPQFMFYNGVYNGNISTNRAICIFEGGTFNGRFFMSVDSSSYARIGGGKFKYMDNLYGSALNSEKFTIGSAKKVFDRGVYVDDEGYIVVGGPVITEFGDKFAAKATNVSKAGSYLPYSSAAEHGLYYTNAEMAIAKHGEANVVLP